MGAPTHNESFRPAWDQPRARPAPHNESPQPARVSLGNAKIPDSCHLHMAPAWFPLMNPRSRLEPALVPILARPGPTMNHGSRPAGARDPSEPQKNWYRPYMPWNPGIVCSSDDLLPPVPARRAYHGQCRLVPKLQTVHRCLEDHLNPAPRTSNSGRAPCRGVLQCLWAPLAALGVVIVQ